MPAMSSKRVVIGLAGLPLILILARYDRSWPYSDSAPFVITVAVWMRPVARNVHCSSHLIVDDSPVRVNNLGRLDMDKQNSTHQHPDCVKTPVPTYPALFFSSSAPPLSLYLYLTPLTHSHPNPSTRPLTHTHIFHTHTLITSGEGTREWTARALLMTTMQM